MAEQLRLRQMLEQLHAELQRPHGLDDRSRELLDSSVKRSGDRPRPCAKPTSYITFSLSAVTSTITAAASSIALAKVE